MSESIKCILVTMGLVLFCLSASLLAYPCQEIDKFNGMNYKLARKQVIKYGYIPFFFGIGSTIVADKPHLSNRFSMGYRELSDCYNIDGTQCIYEFYKGNSELKILTRNKTSNVNNDIVESATLCRGIR